MANDKYFYDCKVLNYNNAKVLKNYGTNKDDLVIYDYTDYIKLLLINDSNDKNNVFKENAEYFYYIEGQYNINGLFVAAVGIHESAWGTSNIANNKKNLFGYGAYDDDPGGSSYTFQTYAEGIDLVSRVFMKYYLNPKGTPIYGGETAVGTYYEGATLNRK